MAVDSTRRFTHRRVRGWGRDYRIPPSPCLLPRPPFSQILSKPCRKCSTVFSTPSVGASVADPVLFAASSPITELTNVSDHTPTLPFSPLESLFDLTHHALKSPPEEAWERFKSQPHILAGQDLDQYGRSSLQQWIKSVHTNGKAEYICQVPL